MSMFLTATNQNIKTCQPCLSLQLSKHLWRGYHVLIQLDFLPIAICKIFLGSEKPLFCVADHNLQHNPYIKEVVEPPV